MRGSRHPPDVERPSINLLQPVARPSGATHGSDPGSLLREGRVLAARVRAVLLDGTVVLQTSGGQLAARSELPLPLPRGEVLLFRAEQGADGWILRVVTPETRPPDSELRRALLQYVAYARPLGDALADLRSVLAGACGNRTHRPGF